MKRTIWLLAVATVGLAACASGGGTGAGAAAATTPATPAATQGTTTPAPGSETEAPTFTPTKAPVTTSQPTTTARQDLVVAESGFTSFSGDTPYAQYAVVVENPNLSGWAASGVTVTTAFYDAGGDVLTTEEEYLSFVMPGQRAGIGDTAFDTKGAQSMDITVDVDSWEEIDFEPGAYEASRVKVKDDDYSTRITGILKCSFAEDQEDVRVVAVLRNKAGNVIGGDSTYVDKVRCDKDTPFSMTTLGRMRKAATAEILPGN